jgi:hypothetical protein
LGRHTMSLLESLGKRLLIAIRIDFYDEFSANSSSEHEILELLVIVIVSEFVD